MSDGMPGNVAKGAVLKAAEALLNGSGREALADALGLSSILKVADDFNFPPALKQHLSEHLFNDEPPGYWPLVPFKDEVLRAGLIQAIDLATPGNLPIDCFWVCAGHHFQAVATLSPNQVTLLFLTPSLPNNILAPATPNAEEIYFVCDKDDAEAIETVGAFPIENPGGQPIPRPKNQQPITSGSKINGIYVVQVRSS